MQGKQPWQWHKFRLHWLRVFFFGEGAEGRKGRKMTSDLVMI